MEDDDTESVIIVTRETDRLRNEALASVGPRDRRKFLWKEKELSRALTAARQKEEAADRRIRAIREALQAIKKGDNPFNHEKTLGRMDKRMPKCIYHKEQLQDLSDEDEGQSCDSEEEADWVEQAKRYQEEKLEEEERKLSGPAPKKDTRGQPRALACAYSANMLKRSDWIVDSGCTTHICANLSMFKNLAHYTGEVKSASGKMQIRGMGTVCLPVKDQRGQLQVIELREVYYVPEIDYNLLSVVKANKVDGLRMAFDEKKCTLWHEKGQYSVCVPVASHEDLYVLKPVTRASALSVRSGKGQEF